LGRSVAADRLDPGPSAERQETLERLGSAAKGDALHAVADELGKLLRTIFLCDYFTKPDFRRELHTLLNRGESAHQLQRAVYHGRIAQQRGRRRDEMRAISGAHALLTNVVIAWNTMKMQAVVDRWRAENHPYRTSACAAWARCTSGTSTSRARSRSTSASSSTPWFSVPRAGAPARSRTERRLARFAWKSVPPKEECSSKLLIYMGHSTPYRNDLHANQKAPLGRSSGANRQPIIATGSRGGPAAASVDTSDSHAPCCPPLGGQRPQLAGVHKRQRLSHSWRCTWPSTSSASAVPPHAAGPGPELIGELLCVQHLSRGAARRGRVPGRLGAPAAVRPPPQRPELRARL